MIKILDKPSGLILSSSLSSVKVECDRDFIQLALFVDNTEGKMLYYEKLWVYDGSASVHDLAEIAESYMRENNLSICSLYLSVNSEANRDYCSFKVLYAADCFLEEIDVAQWLSNNFLTTHNVRRIAPDFFIPLYYYPDSKDTDSFNVSFYYRVKGSDEVYNASYRGMATTVDSLKFVAFQLVEIKAVAGSNSAVPYNDIILLSWSVSCGSRTASFFVDESLSYGEIFNFRNVFNCGDYICINSLSTQKREVDRSLAVIDGRSVFYDNNVSKSYEVQTGPISQEEAKLLEQLVSSPRVNRVKGKAFHEVLITESDVAHSDSDEMQSVKFTWRYAVNRVVMN